MEHGAPVIDQGMDAYQRYGFAGLFAFLFVCGIVYFLYDKRRMEKEYQDLLVKTVITLEKTSNNIDAQTKVNEKTLALVHTVSETLKLLEGRGESRGGR